MKNIKLRLLLSVLLSALTFALITTGCNETPTDEASPAAAASTAP